MRTIPIEFQVAGATTPCRLMTQGPTCPIAALLHALVSDAEGPYLNRPLSQRKPLSVPDICPAKLVTWQPVIPNGGNPLHGTGANSNPTKVRPGAVLGYPNRVRAGSAERTRLGYGGGSSYRLRGSGGRHSVPRVEPDGPWGYLEAVLPAVSYTHLTLPTILRV